MSIARMNPYGGQVVLDSANNYLDIIGKKRITMDDVSFIDDFVLGGYGIYNNDILNVIKQVLIEDGVPLDTTYTGKSYWGMKEYIKSKKITRKNVLFIHTGGTPLFFDDLEGLMNKI